MGEAPVLEVSGLSAAYEGVTVLHDIDLSVERGSVTAILGANGVGKSTLLMAIVGMVTVTQGEVSFEGEGMKGRSTAERSKRGLCLIPEGRGVFPNLTVRENLWVMSHGGVRRQEIEERAFGQFPKLADRTSQPAGSLSGGEQQMLAMARAIALRPKLLMLDELSMGLAPMVVEELYEHVDHLAKEGITVIVVEQFARIALAMASRGIVMSNGRIAHSGSPDQITSVLHSAYLGGAHGAVP
jgi:branched-chain amino acid transport system ATP-binding protein